MAAATRILNSPLIRRRIYPGLSSHLGFDVRPSMTHASEVQIHTRKSPHTTQRHQRG
uniref:Transposase n=1 Tax=Mesocestoides corti TaxID=53468 RepID=A0A5K3FIQ2_MESCO